MGSKLQSNAIIRGYINSYCLVCECYFVTDEESVEHIEEEAHTEKLSAFPYLEKYGDNHIRKVYKGYYCEFCSLLLTTAAKVALHIQEKAHFDKKGSFLLRRPSGQSSVLAFDDVLIDERAWHSLSEETCAICNEEFSNENIHKTEAVHLLKLVQTKVEFAAGNNLYRKTDDSSFQCLTCNSVFVLNSLNEHFTNSEHKNLYSKCQEEYKKYMEQCKSKAVEKSVKTEVKHANDKKVEDKAPKHVTETHYDGKTQVTEVKTKENNATQKPTVATQKNELKTQKNDVKTKKTETKIEKKDEKAVVDKNHNKISDKAKAEISVHDYGGGQLVVAKIPLNTEPEKDEAAIYANENNLTYNPGNTNAFCRICETKLPAPLRSMKEHVNGKEHKNKLAKVNQNQKTLASNIKTKITRKPMSKFIDYCVNVQNIFHEDVVVNEKYCIPLVSFVMMTQVGGRYRCQLCEVMVYEDDIGEHTDSPRHERGMQDTPVITSVPDTEFVREVRPNIYHCGYCNLILPRWDDVSNHLQSREHRDNKDGCTWRLQHHLPAILEQRRRQDMEVLRMLFMGHMFRRF